MKASTLRPPRRPDLNILKVGSRFVAVTGEGIFEGVYLGLETPYGERSMLMRRADGMISTIPVRRVLSLSAADSAA